jgi:hypothetical protein
MLQVKKISISEILSAIVFLPPAKTGLIKILRQMTGSFFRSLGKLLYSVL